ncbi:D-alanyl-D-alanine carboxypeptidase [Singulisphaera sp. GP187]|uniref:serine hydrolase domain-containing protein n=1 Tax=Singulisphaera sp. GP187 TaxID=1882752 RepID=UPI00092A62AD|nr:serine hydrolase domain-containing protein [Singulisphaera sp. GP187]SIO34546.1 D-alanyl-D-alanine carboxypeptidase [Singulisphaera sp. GP187]
MSQSSQQGSSRRKLSPACEALESRELLTTAALSAGHGALPHVMVANFHAADRAHHAAPLQIAASPTTRTTALNQALQRVMSEFHIPGAVVGVQTPGRPLWMTAQGFSDVASGTPMSLRDRFQIRSVTKSFTVTLVLQLARAHRLSLSDPIGKFVPCIPNGDQITLAQLAGMTSGVKNYTKVKAFGDAFSADIGRQWTNSELVNLAIPESPVFAPGAQYDYSNTNTLLLGMAVEQVTGRPIAQTYRTRLFRPLGLSHTTFPTGFSFATPQPTPYEVDSDTGEPEALPESNLSALGAAGAIVSTLPDMIRWGRALGTGRLIGSELLRLREQTSRPATNGPEYDRYGLGIGQLNGWWGHTGEGFGFQAATMYDPATRSVIAVALNSSQSENVATQIFKALAAVVRPGR